VVITIRLIVSVGIQRLLALTVGEAGIAGIGQVRNVLAMITSTSTLGTFNGIVTYVSRFKEATQELTRLFSTVLFFVLIGALFSGTVLYFGSDFLSNYFLGTSSYAYVFRLIAVITPFIALNRIMGAVINALSKYKKYAAIELISYLLAALAIVIGLNTYALDGVIVAIAITPIIQWMVLLIVFGKELKAFVPFKKLHLGLYYKKDLMAFAMMSFVSAFLLNYIELDIRTLVTNKLNINEAGYWTAMNFISKNYMVFASGLFTLYVLPRFAKIDNSLDFKIEVLHIYKNILPVFALGMVLVYFLRDFIIQIVYPDFTGMEPLFKWQLMGDFIRLCSLVLAHQFLAKQLVKSFVFTELLSLGLFFVLSNIFIEFYGTEGVVMAHFIRYIIYFIVVISMIVYYFNVTAKTRNN
jgi:O-antigen/teichoic acid export membrane protein